jgi:ATP/maltotriose-dependent transcriptional regulator MalT
MGRPLEAERMLRRSIEIGMAGGSDARIEPISWANLARALVDLGRYAESLPLAERAMRQARERGDTVVADQAQLMTARANVLAGRLDRGEALLDDVERRFRAMFPPSHPAFAAVAIDRVRIALERGDLARAGRLADEALAMVTGDPRHSPARRPVLRLRAELRLRLRQFAEARADADEIVALSAGAAGTRSSFAGIGHLLRAQALLGERRTAEARAAAAEAWLHLEPTAGGTHPFSERARAIAQGGPVPVAARR